MIELFQEAKNWLTDSSGLARDALHIHMGLVIFFALHWIFAQRLGRFLPLVLLGCFVLLGELLDVLAAAGSGQPQDWVENLLDIWNTMFWPLLLVVYGRWGPKELSTMNN